MFRVWSYQLNVFAHFYIHFFAAAAVQNLERPMKQSEKCAHPFIPLHDSSYSYDVNISAEEISVHVFGLLS